MSITKPVARVKTLPLLALRGLVVFPGDVLHFDIGRPKSLEALRRAMEGDQQIFLLTQRDAAQENPRMADLYPIGTVAHIVQLLRLPGEGIRVLAEGLYRAVPTETEQTEPCFIATVTEKPERHRADAIHSLALMRDMRLGMQEYCRAGGDVTADKQEQIENEEAPGSMADRIGSALPLSVEEKMRLLSAVSVTRRAELLLSYLQRERQVQGWEADIHKRVQEHMDENQRDYYLREQMKVIAEELGEDENPLEEAEELRRKVKALALPEETEQKLCKECDKLSKMPLGSQEATVVRMYLDACLSLPWHTKTAKPHTLKEAKHILERDHYGLEKVKEQILEILAVRTLAPDCKGQVICLVGPPGVGKTSVARSIAEATGRQYVRVSLGGVRDESDIRGHRRTYVGSMMGRILHAVVQAGCKDPLILLDEIDKLGHDFRGDPSAALLEVLDAEQNSRFVDHYIDLPFDLSEVLFLTTANDPSAIPAPLYDRMDVITLPSYTAEEKRHIARSYLVKKQCRANGLTAKQIRFSDEALKRIIDGYTREAGVRELERQIGKICRKAARRIVEDGVTFVSVRHPEEFLGPVKYLPDRLPEQNEVGVVNGLAWTSVGGEMLPIEVAILEGSGKIELTGSLGDVMKESAHIAISYVRAHAEAWGIDPTFYRTKDVHIHAPEGAVPKDGPSAGVAMTTALVSALTGIPVRHDVAMTGEISLRGKVLPIGGLREKTMAAYLHHMHTVILPADNRSDLAELAEEVRQGLNFLPAEQMETVLTAALCAPLPAVRTEAPKKTAHTAVGHETPSDAVMRV